MCLISPKLVSYFKKATLFGQFVCSHPFEWDQRLNRPLLCKSKKKFYLWCINVGIGIFYSFFVILRCVQVNTDKSGKYSPVSKIYMQCIVFYYAFPALFQIGIVFKKKHLLLFFTQNVKGMAELGDNLLSQRTGNRGGPLSPKIFDLFYDFLWYGLLTFPSLIGILATFKSDSPEFISSVILPERGFFRWLILLPCVVFQTHYIVIYAANGLTFMYFGLGFVFPGVVVLARIKCWMELETISQERVVLILHMYKKLEIMRKSFHFVFCTFFLPCIKGTLMGVVIFCCYGVFRMKGLIIIFLAFLGMVCFTVLLVLMISFAKFYNMSSEILFLLKSPKFYNSLNAYQRKDQLSLTPIRMQVDSAYYIDTPCVITVLKIVVDTTINLLLTHR